MKETKQNDDDEAIILSGCGLITQYMFPADLDKCPVPKCHAIVKNRSEAISHYRESHARKSILCPLCEKPICGGRSKFMRHHHRIHPNMAMQFEFNETTKKSKKSTPQTKQVCIHIQFYVCQR